MASDAGPQGNPLATYLDSVAASPERHDFFHLLRMVDAAQPQRPRLGESARPAQDALRIGQEPSMAFAPRPVAGLDQPQADMPARLQSYFFGLFGPNGPLPLHLTEHAHAQALNERNPAFSRFADMLTHRVATLFYRAWAEAEPTVSHDRRMNAEDDRFSRQIGALAGYGMASLEQRDAMPDLLKRHFTGRLAAGARNPEGLVTILSSYFDAPVEIEEFVPIHAPLPKGSRFRLGRGATPATLGVTTTLGRQMRIHHHSFRITIGPVDLETYARFLPDGAALPSLIDIVRNYVGEMLEWELNLALAAPEVPTFSLGRTSRLGLTSWLARRRSSEPARDLTLGRASRNRAAKAASDAARPDAAQHSDNPPDADLAMTTR